MQKKKLTGYESVYTGYGSVSSGCEFVSGYGFVVWQVSYTVISYLLPDTEISKPSTNISLLWLSWSSNVFQGEDQALQAPESSFHCVQAPAVPHLPGHDSDPPLAQDRLGHEHYKLGLLVQPHFFQKLLYWSLHQFRRSFERPIFHVSSNQFPGFALCLLNSLLACCFVLSSSNKLLVLVVFNPLFPPP